ncbi:metal-sensing transcriptional repressor, partial [Jeotgalibaca porci]
MEITNKNVINRLKRTEGQVRGIQKMIEEEKD